MAGSSPAMTKLFPASLAKNFFIIFVDAMFTISFEPLFTNSFDDVHKTPAAACV
jgi:hypothetical protein